jgi:hypothetical protein
MKKFLVFLFASLAWMGSAQAQIIGALPYTFVNGQVADANQVMANFNFIVNSTNSNAANGGINTNITQLNALTTPLTPAQGGTSVYIGGTSTNVGNAYTIGSPTPLGFTLTAGKTVCFIINAANTGAVTLNVNATGATNMFRQPINSGPGAMVGGELATGAIACAYYDGTQFQCTNCNHPIVGAIVDYTGVVVPPGWASANGQALNRTTYAVAFNTIAYTNVSATTTITSTTVNITGANTFIQGGWYVGGPSVTCNSTVTGVAANSITISNPAGASGSTTLTIGPYPQGDCSTTFNAPNFTGRVTAQVDGTTNITNANCANASSLGATCGAQTLLIAQNQLPNIIPTFTGTTAALNQSNIIQYSNTFPTFAVAAGSGEGFNTATPPTQINPTVNATGTISSINGNVTQQPMLNLQPLGIVYKIMKL